MGDGAVVERRASLVNLRDVGSLRTVTGSQVVPGALYRSEAPQHGDAEPLDVPEWPVRTVIDLRSAIEVDADHPLKAAGARIHHVPLTVELAPGATARSMTSADIAALYVRLVRDSSKQIAHVATTVAHSPGPVLIHCAAGKDRTGVVVAILLRLLGVHRADVLADYERTTARLPELWDRLTQAGVHLPTNHALLAVVPEALTAVMDLVDMEPGGVAAWLADAGVDADTQQLLRERLTTD